MREIKGCRAVVTGASGEIGAAVTRRLARAGARTVLVSRDPGALCRQSLAPGAEVVGSVAEAQARGSASILVLCAATDRAAPFRDRSVDDVCRHLKVDLVDPLLEIGRVLPGMVVAGAGHVVVVGSQLALVGGAFEVPYAAAKGGLDAAMRALAAEHRGSGVGFSIVHPAPVRGAGRYARRRRMAGRVPCAVGETSAARVARAVESAIRHGRRQVLVGRGLQGRLLLALQALSPRAADAAVAASGVTRWFADVAGDESEGAS